MQIIIEFHTLRIIHNNVFCHIEFHFRGLFFTCADTDVNYLHALLILIEKTFIYHIFFLLLILQVITHPTFKSFTSGLPSCFDYVKRWLYAGQHHWYLMNLKLSWKFSITCHHVTITTRYVALFLPINHCHKILLFSNRLSYCNNMLLMR